MTSLEFALAQDTIRQAMAFPMDEVVERYARDYEVTFDVARKHERELKRYLIMCALNPGGCYGMKGPVDNFWHTFILFTRQYAGFCQSVAGRFIHHTPTQLGGTKSEDRRGSYAKTLKDYEMVFGETPPHQSWPQNSMADCNTESECSGSGGNDGGCEGRCDSE